MKFKMAKNSVFAQLLRANWYVSGFIGAFMGLIGVVSMPPGYRLFGTIMGIPFIIISFIRFKQQWDEPGPMRTEEVLQAMRKLNWEQFSAEVEMALVRDGYVVKRLNTPDADFEIKADGRTALVSCKRWRVVNTGIEPLKELQKAVEKQGATEGFYITAGEYTQTALNFAAEKKIRLINGMPLVKLLRELRYTETGKV
ncbi:MAG: restriction endonuclease [Oxalicibacterium faecigallinarum]|uniref:Restriction endonuclease type IV Mrr domain-containing protein n=1 Tax=Oxalicibacterium faecigallinarum TaxID=573741 RepID=A0A8J3AM57_9BURK|nr:restriction endonuclease [Oxalicibacterium faecigallinarum]MDQ7968335.1 restriction endonuclease [Oxalicibacterium faecigallinarum]GGI17232.1 hypothetical protein GCM10008066_07950 [Oxalicibacterium faecigallinarum]